MDLFCPREKRIQSDELRSFRYELVEAWIIDFALRPQEEDMRHVLIQVGLIIAGGQPGDITVDEEDLWIIRDSIDPKWKVGTVTGMDVITKVYREILEFQHKEFPGKAEGLDLDLPSVDSPVPIERAVGYSPFKEVGNGGR